jgi:hypothetical protein
MAPHKAVAQPKETPPPLPEPKQQKSRGGFYGVPSSSTNIGSGRRATFLGG